MKKLVLLGTAMCAFTFASFPAQAAMQGEFSANVGLVSEYSFRGLAQSDEHMAVQGGFDYSHDSGFYAGVWGSNVDFNDGDEAQVELDAYAGVSGEFDNGIAWDLGAIYYMYPGANSNLDYDYIEAAGSLGYDFGLFSLSGAVNYSPDFFAGSGDALYTAAYVDVPLPYDFTLGGHVGYQSIDDNTAFGVPDYTDWSVDVGYSWQGFDFSLSYVDTDLDEPSECADGCDARIIFGISRSF